MAEKQAKCLFLIGQGHADAEKEKNGTWNLFQLFSSENNQTRPLVTTNGSGFQLLTGRAFDWDIMRMRWLRCIRAKMSLWWFMAYRLMICSIHLTKRCLLLCLYLFFCICVCVWHCVYLFVSVCKLCSPDENPAGCTAVGDIFSWEAQTAALYKSWSSSPHSCRCVFKSFSRVCSLVKVLINPAWSW